MLAPWVVPCGSVVKHLNLWVQLQALLYLEVDLWLQVERITASPKSSSG